MKYFSMMALAVAVMMTACERPLIEGEEPEVDGEGMVVPDQSRVKKFTFTLKGDFSNEWKPVNHRAAGYLAADGKDMTDVWVLDYMGGELVQQLHQGDNTAEEFGQPSLNLKYGVHHIYFIASRGQSPQIDTDAHTITFAKVSDTFWRDYEVSVVSTSNGNRAVELNRCVTRLRLTFTDAVVPETSTINITPNTWYYGFDYTDGTPCEVKTFQSISITIPDNEKGKTGLLANIFSFSTSDEWTTSVSINSKKADGSVIGSAVINDAPFKANRITEYSGPLFGSDGAISLSLNGEWEDSYQGTW